MFWILLCRCGQLQLSGDIFKNIFKKIHFGLHFTFPNVLQFGISFCHHCHTWQSTQLIRQDSAPVTHSSKAYYFSWKLKCFKVSWMCGCIWQQCPFSSANFTKLGMCFKTCFLHTVLLTRVVTLSCGQSSLLIFWWFIFQPSCPSHERACTFVIKCIDLYLD